MDETYDKAFDAVEEIKTELDTCLQTYKELFKDRRVCFSHAKFRYEVEIPEEHVKNEKPLELELTS